MQFPSSSLSTQSPNPKPHLDIYHHPPTAIDIFSVGAILFTLLTSSPFPYIPSPTRPIHQSHAPAATIPLLTAFLNPDPHKRPTATDALRQPLFATHNQSPHFHAPAPPVPPRRDPIRSYTPVSGVSAAGTRTPAHRTAPPTLPRPLLHPGARRSAFAMTAVLAGAAWAGEVGGRVGDENGSAGGGGFGGDGAGDGKGGCVGRSG